MVEAKSSGVPAKPDGESLWSAVLLISTNPTLIAVRILSERIPGICIASPRIPADSVGYIYATSEGERVLNLVCGTTEFGALWAAFVVARGEPQVDSCQWDDSMKARVGAFYWQNREYESRERADFYLGLAEGFAEKNKPASDTNRSCAQAWAARAEAARTKTQELLGTLPPLGAEDMQGLVENIVDGILAVK